MQNSVKLGFILKNYGIHQNFQKNKPIIKNNVFVNVKEPIRLQTNPEVESFSIRLVTKY